jgi:amidase
VAEDAFELAGDSVVQALEPFVDALASIFAGVDIYRLAPVSLAEWSAYQQVLQGREAWQSVRDWIEEVNPRFSFEVSERYTLAKAVTVEEAAAAAPGRQSVVDRMDQVLTDDSVVCLPTTVSPAPLRGQRVSERHFLRLHNSHLTSIAGLAGVPQITLPLAEVDGKPVGFSLMGPRGSDQALIALAQEFELALAS